MARFKKKKKKHITGLLLPPSHPLTPCLFRRYGHFCPKNFLTAVLEAEQFTSPKNVSAAIRLRGLQLFRCGVNGLVPLALLFGHNLTGGHSLNEDIKAFCLICYIYFIPSESFSKVFIVYILSYDGE